MNNLFKNPPALVLVLAYILTLISVIGSVVILLVDYRGTALEILAYSLFGIAGVSLSYTVFTLIKFMPKIKAAVGNLIKKSPVASKYVSDFGFRALVGSLISLSFGILFGIFNGVMGVLAGSVWYGSLSLYYILTALIYGSIVLKRKKGDMSYAIFVRCGIMELVVHLALSVAIAQMIFDHKSFLYGGLTIYAFAAYAFAKITVAIIQLCKKRHRSTPCLHATALVNLTCGAVSILALQTALLSTFGKGVDTSLFNTLTGSAVSLGALGISIYMIFKGIKNERK